MSTHTIATIHTAALHGFSGVPVRVEADIRAGLPSLQVVGMGNKAIDEARQRVRSAILNSGLQFPRQKLVINLSPAELPKDGTHYDLPIAISILETSGQLKAKHTAGSAFVGELSLGGDILPIRGVTLLVEAAKAYGATKIYLPATHVTQAQLVSDIEIIPVHTLTEVFQILRGVAEPKIPEVRPIKTVIGTPHPTIQQAFMQRALTIAAAGRHNILLYGPPGTGKTHLAKAAAGLLPVLSQDEVLEATKLHSLTTGSSEVIITAPPVRQPNHSVTKTAFLGGGVHPKPGEVSLAHKGILLLDELPEYPREILESLRQPMEEKQITISRLHGSITYPADALIIATMNPCPCGYYQDTEKACTCSQGQINAYKKKLSGPLLDRIDLFIYVPRAPDEYFFDTKTLQKTQQQTDTKLVQSISNVQKQRYKRSSIYNGNATLEDVRILFKITPGAHKIMRQAQGVLSISNRGILKTLRVARTIADLAESATVEAAHVSEALQFRRTTL